MPLVQARKKASALIEREIDMRKRRVYIFALSAEVELRSPLLYID